MLRWLLGSTILQFGTDMEWSLASTLPFSVCKHFLIRTWPSDIASRYGTSLVKPSQWTWLPETPQAGFADWYIGEAHYNAQSNFLKGLKTNFDLIPDLRHVDLRSLTIRNVLFLTLESTRKDVFPVRPNSNIWQRVTNTFKRRQMSSEVEDALLSLTPYANYLIGHNSSASRWAARGSLSTSNAFTTSTYNLKSLTGIHCGVMPIAGDFNVERSNHIYQPCLPHIFDAFNQFNASEEWRSSFMQSTCLDYDKQAQLMPKLGFKQVIGEKYLKEMREFPASQLPEVNYFGLPEEALERHIRRAFAEARKNNQRLFLSRLTSTTRHAYGIPKTVKRKTFTGTADEALVSDYLKAVGYVDQDAQRCIMRHCRESGLRKFSMLLNGGYTKIIGDGAIVCRKFAHAGRAPAYSFT